MSVVSQCCLAFGWGLVKWRSMPKYEKWQCITSFCNDTLQKSTFTLLYFRDFCTNVLDIALMQLFWFTKFLYWAKMFEKFSQNLQRSVHLKHDSNKKGRTCRKCSLQRSAQARTSAWQQRAQWIQDMTRCGALWQWQDEIIRTSALATTHQCWQCLAEDLADPTIQWAVYKLNKNEIEWNKNTIKMRNKNTIKYNIVRKPEDCIEHSHQFILAICQNH